MRLLETIGDFGGTATLSQLSAAIGLTKSTVHGVLNTLVDLGYVTRDGTRYVLGNRLEVTARPIQSKSQQLRRSFAPALRAFNELCGENCFLAVPGGTRTFLTLDSIDREGLPLSLPVDSRRDALTTSAAEKILLANDPELTARLNTRYRISPEFQRELSCIGARRYAVDIKASQNDLNCVALPLRLQGRVVAALSAAGPASRLNPDFMRRLARRSMQQLLTLVKY